MQMRDNAQMSAEPQQFTNPIDWREPVTLALTVLRDAHPDLDLLQQADLDRVAKQYVNLPILEGAESVGAAKEGSLMARVIESPAALDKAVSRFMDPPFPVVGEHDPLDHVLRLFTRENEAVLVRRGSPIVGILTRFDVIQHMAGR